MTPPRPLHSCALLAEDLGEELLVGPDKPDHLLDLNLLRELDCRHVVSHVTLATVSAGRALPLIDILALGRGGGARLGHEPDPDDIRVLRPLRIERQHLAP